MPYRLWIENQAKVEVNRLPGHMRQRARQAIRGLSVEPRPHDSRALRTVAAIELEVRRLRLEQWRIVYVVDEQSAEVGVLAIRKRPPYDYGDLPELFSGLQE